MSVDYSLFMLSRWTEEIRKGRDVVDATIITILHTGHTVLISGLTLSACTLGLMIIPMDLLASLGYALSPSATPNPNPNPGTELL
jgi:RND superfamily putative drug exporter